MDGTVHAKMDNFILVQITFSHIFSGRFNMFMGDEGATFTEATRQAGISIKLF
jgi:hypothetical protein